MEKELEGGAFNQPKGQFLYCNMASVQRTGHGRARDDVVTRLGVWALGQ